MTGPGRAPAPRRDGADAGEGWRRATVAWEGREIATATAGSGPHVVFGHGTPFSSELWEPFARSLARDFTVHLWDMPGYGRSSQHAEHPVDFAHQAEALTHLVTDHWRLAAPHVVAHDIGGAVALRATLVHGLRYASLLLLDAVAIPPAGSPFYRYVQTHADVLAELPATIHAAVVRAYVQGAAHRPLPADALDALVAPWLGEVGQPAFYRQIAQYDERVLVDNEDRLAALEIPVRVLWGERDAWLPVATGRRLAGLIPGATFALVEDAGHLVQLDQPGPLADELRAWLVSRTNFSPAEAGRMTG